ncbi:MAG: sensor histidine kinase [Candidatus Binatia bacterium]
MFRRFADWLTDLLFEPGRRRRLAVLSFFLIVLFPVFLIATLSYWQTDRELTRAAYSRRQTIAYLAAVTVKEKLDRMTDLAVSLATPARFRQLVGAGDWEPAIKLLLEVPKNFPFVDRILLTDPEGTLMANRPRVIKTVDTSLADTDWYQGVSRSKKPYVSEVYQRSGEPAVSVVAVAVPIRRQREADGILVLEVRLSAFLDWTKNIDVGPSGFIYFVDGKGSLVAHPNYPPEGKLVDFSAVPEVKNVLSGQRGVEVQVNPLDKEERIAAYEPVPGYGWGVIAAQSTAAALVTRRATLNRLLRIYGFIILLSCGLAYVIWRTLAERKMAEQESRKLNEELKQQAFQLEAANRELEAFSYSVSHDLRAPLRSINGFSQALLEDCGAVLDATGKDHLRRVRAATQRMGQLIEGILELSRVTRSQIRIENVNLSALAEEVAADLRASNPERAAQFQIAADASVRGDSRLLRAALANLLDNAWKFTSNQPLAKIEFGVTHNNSGARVFFVRDNGAGFDMAFVDKLFGAFQRLHHTSEFEGTGIGLATVQRIVYRHGGKIWAEGAVNKGATLYFTLPD